MLVTEDERNCIKSLYLADYATKLDEIPAREPGTCEWVLCHRNLREWADIGRSALLWLSGNPGCGKTVISSFLIESFRKSNDTVVYFICDNKHADFRTKESILGSLLHQLIVSNPILVRHATAHYKYKKESIASSAATLWAIFEDILRGEDIATVYCILDALDECEDETRKWILRKLSRLFSVRLDGRAHGSKGTGHLKMVITSRPWEDVELGLAGASKIRLRTEDEANINHDIRLFVKKQVKPLAERRGYTTHQRETVIKTLVEKANGMFLWVSLIIDDLERTPICNIERRLQELPNTLHRLYEKILARVDLGAVERVKHILTWVVTAFRPLTVQELAIACELQQLHGLGHINIEDLVNYIKGDIGLCGPLLTIRTGYVNLVHQSAKDFLLQAQYRPGLYSSLSNYHINPAHSHAQLALLCIRYLSFDEFEISLLPINGLYKDYDLFEAHLDAFPFLKYAAINWPEHFRNSGECLLSSLESVKNFFGLSYKAAAWFQIFFFSNDDRFADCPSGGSSLHFATYIGILPIIELLLHDEEVEIDVEDDEGKTPLCWAIEYPLNLPKEKLGERSSVAQLILQAGANVKSQDYRVGATLLHWSVRYHKDQIAEQLIRAGANVNAQDYQMQTPLHWAAEDSYLGDRMADLLLKNGAYIDAIDDSGQTPLHVALEHDRDNVIILRLLEANASTHAMERNGMTPLLSALERSNYEAAELLLRKGADIKGKGPSGRPALHQAAEKGYEAVFMLLLEKGADIEAKDSFGLTALQRAAMNGHEAIVRQILGRKGVNVGPMNCLAIARLYRATESGNEVVVWRLLQEKGVDVEGRDSSGRTMLHRAAENGHHKVVRLLLEKGANVEAEGPSGRTMPHRAAENGHHKVVRLLLLKKGANVKAKDFSGLTALSLAAENGYDAVVQLLLESGADVEARDRWGPTALHRAAGNGHEAVVRLLLSAGADVDAMNDERRTALQRAAQSGHKEVVQLLLEKGADIEAKDRFYGCTALFRATMKGHDVVVRLLLDQGANVIAMTNNGDTALNRAARYGYAAVVRLLLERGADVKGKDSSKRTALHHAAEYGYTAVVRLLLEKGADVEVKDPSKRTALHHAAEYGYTAVVRLLLEKGADVEVKDPSGRTALHRAVENEHEAVVRLLLQTKESGATEDSAETEENAEKRFPTLSRQHSVRQDPF
jgi:ankyrin repeat protein